MSKEAAAIYTPEQVEHVLGLRCRRWGADSQKVIRALLIAKERPKEVADRTGKKPQHVFELRRRFLERMRDEYGTASTVVRVSADEFMAAVAPPAQALLNGFRGEIERLNNHGYTIDQIRDFLARNNLDVSVEDIQMFLGAMK